MPLCLYAAIYSDMYCNIVMHLHVQSEIANNPTLTTQLNEHQCLYEFNYIYEFNYSRHIAFTNFTINKRGIHFAHYMHNEI